MSESCDDVTCPFCTIHCPWCGAPFDALVFRIATGEIACPTCGVRERAPCPAMIASRHRQVVAITGRTIPEWKARATQLNRRFLWRWRSTMNYLDPAASAALSVADELMLTTGCSEAEAIAEAQRAYPLLQALVTDDPPVTEGLDAVPYLDDWF